MSQSYLSIQKALVEARQRDLATIPQESARPVRLKPGEPTQTESRRWRAFALLVVAYFMTIVDLTVVNVALPTIGVKLHFPESDLQWVVTAYGLTFGGFLLLGGRAADLLGRRRLLMVGLAIFTAASLACGLATSDTFLIVMRGIQGFGAAITLPAALSIVMNMFPEGAERNKALGIWGAMGAMGATIGVLAGGLLTRYMGWQYIFFFNVPIGAAALALAPRIVPESRLRSERRRYDPFGAVTITAGLVVLVYAISQAPQVGWAATQTVAMLATAAALLVSFFVIEARVEAPLLPMRLFRLSTVAGSNAVGFLLGASFFTFIFVGTLYMQQVLGFSALKTGLAWLTASVTSVAFAGLSQMLVTKTSAKLVMAFGMALIGGGILWATQIPADGNFWHDLAGPFFVAGMGTAFAFIPVSIGALAGVTERDAGVASGLLNTSQQLGGAIGVAVASSVAASHFRTLVHHGYGNGCCSDGRVRVGPVGLRADRSGRRPRDLPAHPTGRDGQGGRPHAGARGRHRPRRSARSSRGVGRRAADFCSRLGRPSTRLTSSQPEQPHMKPGGNTMTVRELSGTTAIVTGASKGFGRATAIALAGRGAHVVGVARSADLLDELRDQLGDRFTPEVADVTDPTLPERLLSEYRPQTLVLNAGASPGSRPAPRADLGDVQHQLACGRPPGLQLRESQPSRSARTGFGGGHDLEWRGITWLAGQRRLRRCQGDGEVHQFLRRSRGSSRDPSGFGLSPSCPCSLRRRTSVRSGWRPMRNAPASASKPFRTNSVRCSRPSTSPRPLPTSSRTRATPTPPTP